MYAAAIILLGIMVTACRDNSAIRVRYDLEKQYFRSERLARDLLFGLAPCSASDSGEIRAAYSRLVENCYVGLNSVKLTENPVEYGDIETLTFKSASRLSQFLFAARRFDSCQALIRQLLASVRLNNVEQMITQFNLGRALQANGQWDSATSVYDAAVTRFYPPLTAKGDIVYELFNLPLHLYQVTSKLGFAAEANHRLELAESYYRWITTDFPDSKLYGASCINLAAIYEQEGRYAAAIDQLNGIVDSGGRVDYAAYLRMADLYAFKLNDLDQALEIYVDVEKGLPPGDSLLAPIIQLKKSMIHFHKRDYSLARQILVRLSKEYPKFYFSTPAAQLAKAQSFDREGNWLRAESEYRFLIENYSGTDEAMSTYLYLARYFERQGRQREAESWYQRAERQYTGAAKRRASPEEEAVALSYQAEMHRQKNDIPAAIRTLELIFERFPTSPVGHRALLTATRLYADELRDQAKADSLTLVLRNALTEVDAGLDIYDL